MTGVWSSPPLGRIAGLDELGAFGENLGEHNGEARRVCRLQKYPDWIFKEYRVPVPVDGLARLTRLIQFPEQMSGTDLALVDGHTSWPATRVVDSRRQTIGVMMPLAPGIFSATLQKPSGRTERKTLEVDVLALPGDRQAKLNLPSQSLAERISVCASVAAVGALFERKGLVYLDWSYTNVFWSLGDHSAYVIDLDGSSFGPRPQIQQPNWQDPLVPRGNNAGNESDRYRVALLTARCLTGLRTTVPETRMGLESLRARGAAISQVAQLLIEALDAGSTIERPTIVRLSAALEAAKTVTSGSGVTRPAETGGVREWKSVAGRGNSTSKVTIPPPPTPATGPASSSTSPLRSVAPSGTMRVPASRTSVASPAASGPNLSTVNRPMPPPPTPASRPSGSAGAAVAMVAIAIVFLIIMLSIFVF